MSSDGGTGSAGVKALVFDVFGTVVNWRTSVVGELTRFGTKHVDTSVDWHEFADEWRAGYGMACRELSRGVGNWRNVDEIHRNRLDELIARYGVQGSFDGDDLADLNNVWHRLAGWPDSPGGLRRLKSKYIISTLSNGNFGLLVDMAKHAGLPWDAILSADVVGAYKPNPRVYSTACRLLGIPNEQVMMVAAHGGDLDAASELGLRTAFVHRPSERGGPADTRMPEFASGFDFAATDMNDLADQLGCA